MERKQVSRFKVVNRQPNRNDVVQSYSWKRSSKPSSPYTYKSRHFWSSSSVPAAQAKGTERSSASSTSAPSAPRVVPTCTNLKKNSKTSISRFKVVHHFPNDSPHQSSPPSSSKAAGKIISRYKIQRSNSKAANELESGLGCPDSRKTLLKSWNRNDKRRSLEGVTLVSRFRLVRDRRKRASTAGSTPKAVSDRRRSSARYVVSRNGLALRRRSKTDGEANKPSRLQNFTTPQKRKLTPSVQSARKSANCALNRSLRTVNRKRMKVERRHCMFFNRYGRCCRGAACPFVHDPAQVAVCSRFLRGRCPGGARCRFSHRLSPDRMPICKFFEEGVCSRPNCAYLHVKHSADALPCRQFQLGHCPNGVKCQWRHVKGRDRKVWRPAYQLVAHKWQLSTGAAPKDRSLGTERVMATVRRDEAFDLIGDFIPLPSDDA